MNIALPDTSLVPAPITATLIPDEQRLSFWPQHFSTVPQWILLEPRVFSRMGSLCADYTGGIWNFFTLSNGGAFIAPDGDEAWALFNALNGNSAILGNEAAGIAVCLLAWNHHAWHTSSDVMCDHFYRLRDYALQHPECSAILQIID